MALPELREELELIAGARLADGQPSWTLHDPVRHLFFRIDWSSFEILSRWWLDDEAAIADSVARATPLLLEADDVRRFSHFLIDNQLVIPRGRGAARWFAERRERDEPGPLNWLLHHYLFFRVPLVRPDAWLERWKQVAGLFVTRTFLLLTLCALGVGLHQVARQWDGFMTSLLDTFSLSGLLGYAAAIAGVKVLHELGHAFTAKRMGCRVPAMGVAFLVMWPVAYTDTNETWRLANSRDRLKVACAGIATELVVAAWASLAWALLPDGSLRQGAFVLATTSWVSSVIINASPFMRFDGYFILSDLLDIPNLHERAGALARWWLRERLFALGDAKPEHHGAGLEKGLIAFAIVTWLYRLVVFLGIALLVYHAFFKALGIVLFAVEIAWFIAFPIWRELGHWWRRRAEICATTRSRRTLWLAVAALLLFALPLPARVTVSGILRPAQVWAVHAPAGARVASFSHGEGSVLKAGTEVLSLDNAELETRAKTLRKRIEALRWSAAATGVDPRQRARLQSSQDELATAVAELDGVERDLARYAPTAPFDGELRDVDPDLAQGQWVSAREPLALLVAPGERIVETWLDEESVRNIAVGSSALFIADGRDGPALRLHVTRIDHDSTRIMDSGMLTVAHGGHVLARERDGKLVPEQALYRVTLAADEPLGRLEGQTWRGSVVIRGGWDVPALRYLRNAAAVIIREACW